MFSVSVWIALVVALLAYLTYRKQKNGINLPGPIDFPLVGNMLEMEARFYRTLVKWSKKYGGLCKWVGPGGDEIVLIGDPKIAREMLLMDAFSGRAFRPEFTLFEGENRGIINSEGDVWEQQRRFTLRQLRDFGFGKTSMESITMEEVKEFIERLVEKKGEPIPDVKAQFSLATVNSLWNILAGKRFSQTDSKLAYISGRLTGAFDDAAKVGPILAFAPWVKYIIPEKSGYNSIRRMFKAMAEFIGETIKEHEETYQEDSTRDFIDVFIKEMRNPSSPTSFHGDGATKQLINVVSDFFQGGSDTTSTILNWSVLFLMKNPKVQKKFQEEIDRVVGNSRYVSFQDRPDMLYAQAFINEVLRKGNAPFGVPHKVAFDVEYRGVFFPKDTGLFFNIEWMHNDPKHWDEPEQFKPERFLSEDGKSLKNHEAFMPFLFGKRQCPGMTLGKDVTFLFITNLLQRFDIVEDPNEPADLEPAVSFVIVPKPYKVIFRERKEE